MESFPCFNEKQKLLALSMAFLMQGFNQFANGTDNFINKMLIIAVFSWIDLTTFIGAFKKKSMISQSILDLL